LTNTKQPVDRRPTLNEVLRLVARLGGFIGRKSDGEPAGCQQRAGAGPLGVPRRG